MCEPAMAPQYRLQFEDEAVTYCQKVEFVLQQPTELTCCYIMVDNELQVATVRPKPECLRPTGHLQSLQATQ